MSCYDGMIFNKTKNIKCHKQLMHSKYIVGGVSYSNVLLKNV